MNQASKDKMILLALLVMALTFISFELLAKSIEVDSLESGACWVSGEDSKTKVASFTDNLALILQEDSYHHLQEEITAALRDRGIGTYPATLYSLHLYCNFQGATFRANLFNGEKKLCIYLMPTKSEAGSAGFTVTAVYSNNEGDKGFCNGEQPGGVLLDLSKFALEDAKNCAHILQREYDEVIMLQQLQGQEGVYFIKIKNRDYFYREWLLVEQLTKDNLCSGNGGIFLTKELFEYNPIMTPVGSSLKIHDGEYAGF
ncbi:MAG: hypothetical protein HQK50_07455 [Oligoflexia bacterium]|nr:hypothetical protein [Oligoflexia bacterium]MBF0365391.1 hypothetical protein [Oligoflexia bacterium]